MSFATLVHHLQSGHRRRYQLQTHSQFHDHRLQQKRQAITLHIKYGHRTYPIHH